MPHSASVMTETANFSAPAQEYAFDGLLFDNDGTIIDSTDAIVKHWHKYVESDGNCARELS